MAETTLKIDWQIVCYMSAPFLQSNSRIMIQKCNDLTVVIIPADETPYRTSR